MQPGEGELHLRLDARGAHHAAARRVLGDVLQERRLAHARLAAQNERPASTCANRLDQTLERPTLGTPADEFGVALLEHGNHDHLPGPSLHAYPQRLTT